MITWTRAELKTRAKTALHTYYWKMVLVALILSVITGGGAGGSSSQARRSMNNSGQNSQESISDLQREFEGILNDDGSGYIQRRDDNGNLQGGSAGGALAAAAIILTVVSVILFIATLLSIFLFNPLAAGCRGFFDHIYEREVDISDILSVLRGNYWNGVKICFLRQLYIFLWSLLFVIPGIIKTYQYRMVPYILANDPDKDSALIFQESKEMMEGHKWDAFVLDLSFIGWLILGVITAGLVYIFWTAPYIYATDAALYRKLSNADSMQQGYGAGYGGYYGNGQGTGGSYGNAGAGQGNNGYYGNGQGAGNPYGNAGGAQGNGGYYGNSQNAGNPYGNAGVGQGNNDYYGAGGNFGAGQQPAASGQGTNPQSSQDYMQGTFDQNYFSDDKK